jgi:hypothetical protein
LSRQGSWTAVREAGGGRAGCRRVVPEQERAREEGA